LIGPVVRCCDEPPGTDAGAKKEDVVDAEFTEVDDDKKNKKSA